MIKRISSSLNIFTRKNKRCYVCLPTPYNRSSLSRDHETVTIMNHCCYCFDGLGRMKTKYIVLCWNALAKQQNARGASATPALMINYPTFSFMPWHYQSINGLLSVRSRCCAGHEILWPQEVPVSWEESCHELYAAKRTQKYSKFDKENVYSYHVTYAF